ncbi:MAG TPA: hypothetical protein PLL25_14015, partial [Flavobacteriales bacterium]|nr:hypothetical protein [Flavobacteriales bacterium]
MVSGPLPLRLPLTLLLILALCRSAFAQEVTVDRIMRIGILRDRTVKQVLVMPVRDVCSIIVDGQRKGDLATTDGLKVQVVGGKLDARSLNMVITGARQIEVRPVSAKGHFRLRVPETKMAERTYPGSLGVQVVGGALQLIDRVPLEAGQANALDAWRAIRQQADPERRSMWIAEGVDVKYQEVFDGHHLYNIAWAKDVRASLSDWAGRVRKWASDTN